MILHATFPPSDYGVLVYQMDGEGGGRGPLRPYLDPPMIVYYVYKLACASLSSFRLACFNDIEYDDEGCRLLCILSTCMYQVVSYLPKPNVKLLPVLQIRK